MNLAILIGAFPPGPVGGAEFQAERWALRLSQRHHVTVVTRRNPPGQPPRERRDGFEVVRLGVSRVPIWRTWRDVTGIADAALALDPRPDLLLCFQTFVSGYAGVRIQRRSGIPAVVWIRGDDEIRLERGIARWTSAAVWRAARGVLVQSEAVREQLLAALATHAPAARDEVARKLEVVPNGLDLPDPPFAAGAGVLGVGRLIPQKGWDVLIEALAGTGLALTLAGDGPERARLESLARARGVKARFEGAVSRAALERFYRGAACAVLPSRRGEGLPNALLEAMSFARPVVATPVAGVRDLVRDGANGLLVAPNDAPALRAALQRLAGEQALASRLGAAARATAEGFRWESAEARLTPLLARWAAR